MAKQRCALRIGYGMLGSALIGCFLACGMVEVSSAVLPSQSSEGPSPQQPIPSIDPFGLPGDPFIFYGKHSIMQEAHFGIVNGKITAGIPFKQLGAVEGLWAPPYVSNRFRLTVEVMGQPADLSPVFGL